MPTVGISITKETSFRGVQQNFSNVYHYEVASLPSPETAEDAIDLIVTAEQQMHSTAVSFIFARCWSAGGTPGTNEMIFEKSLQASGGLGGETAMDRERCFLVSWGAGVNTLGRPVYLRKWYHACGSPLGEALTDPQLANTAPLSQAQRDYFATQAEAVREFVIGTTNFFLSSETGRLAGEPAVGYPWLEHHQLGDEWRA